MNTPEEIIATRDIVHEICFELEGTPISLVRSPFSVKTFIDAYAARIRDSVSSRARDSLSVLVARRGEDELTILDVNIERIVRAIATANAQSVLGGKPC